MPQDEQYTGMCGGVEHESNNAMELTAVVSALRALGTDRRVWVSADSSSVGTG
jgi:ribonuclease HI